MRGTHNFQQMLTLLRNKLLEEAQELSEATETDHVAAEAADVIYFTMVAAVKGGASLEQIENHLVVASLFHSSLYPWKC